MANPSEFDLQAAECIDRGLGALGEAARRLVYWYLDSKIHLKRDEIAEDPEQFVAALESLFGQGGGLLERRIIKELEQTFNLTLRKESLVETLALIRTRRQSSPALNRVSANVPGPRRLA